MNKQEFINKYNLELIAIVRSEIEGVKQKDSLYLKDMYIKDGEPIFILTWYNHNNKKFWLSQNGVDQFIKYDNNKMDIKNIQYIYTLINRCVKSYFCNTLKNIKSVEYINNRFILEELKSN